jgi:threonine synthase
MQSTLTHLECPECGRRYDSRRPQTVCKDCNSPLLAKYDLERAGRTLNLEEAGKRDRGIWRWSELLPVLDARHRLTLEAHALPAAPENRSAWRMLSSSEITGSFKARGLAVAVSKAVELGIKELVIPTAGNAGGALAAYAGRAGIAAHVYMPKDAPAANIVEVRAFGAELQLVDGLITDAGREAAQEAKKRRWFDASTFKEPYRVEGKKTMGLELIEHYEGDLPDVIIYPRRRDRIGGMWKAFMRWRLGTRAERPRMVSVQASGCASGPAVETQTDRIEPWQGAETAAAGLRVPSPFADRLILRAIRESHGTAVAVSEAEIADARTEMAEAEGLLAAPEGAAAWACLKRLAAQGWVGAEERVVLFNTGSGLKYL